MQNWLTYDKKMTCCYVLQETDCLKKEIADNTYRNDSQEWLVGMTCRNDLNVLYDSEE